MISVDSDGESLSMDGDLPRHLVFSLSCCSRIESHAGFAGDILRCIDC